MAKLTKIFSPNDTFVPPEEQKQMTLRIVHAGGIVESYYMAVPAARIMERHPRSVLARPGVFRQPWESVVGPDKILTPGEKLYLVPRGTVRKLHLRLRPPSLATNRATGNGSEIERSLCDYTSVAAGQTGTKRVQFIDTWQPLLVAVVESSSSNQYI